MYTDENNNLEKQFEKVPGQGGEAPLTPEQMQEAQEWNAAMAEMPEKSVWDLEGQENTVEPGAAEKQAVGAVETSAETEINADFAGAARINKFFKLDAISDYYGSDGIEKVIDGVSTFDTSGVTPDNVATKFYQHMGINSQEEYNIIRDKDNALKEERSGTEQDNDDKITSMAGLLNDFDNTKNLIEQIKQVDPKASDALEGGNGGYFRRMEEAAMKKFGFGGVTGVLKYLTEKNNAKGEEAKAEFEEIEASIEGEEPEAEAEEEKPEVNQSEVVPVVATEEEPEAVETGEETDEEKDETKQVEIEYPAGENEERDAA